MTKHDEGLVNDVGPDGERYKKLVKERIEVAVKDSDLTNHKKYQAVLTSEGKSAGQWYQHIDADNYIYTNRPLDVADFEIIQDLIGKQYNNSYYASFHGIDNWSSLEEIREQDVPTGPLKVLVTVQGKENFKAWIKSVKGQTRKDHGVLNVGNDIQKEHDLANDLMQSLAKMLPGLCGGFTLALDDCHVLITVANRKQPTGNDGVSGDPNR